MRKENMRSGGTTSYPSWDKFRNVCFIHFPPRTFLIQMKILGRR